MISAMRSKKISLWISYAGDPVCTHTKYGETEEELFARLLSYGRHVGSEQIE
jgi:hypothetical protein